MIYFSSDFHLGHFNIVGYCGRPFATLKEMDDTIIKNINDIVDENDTLFFLGDFCMKKSSMAPDAEKDAYEYYRNQIKCKNMIFIRGNHDHNNLTKTIIESIVIEFGGKRIFMTHDPKYAKKEFTWNFCGHTHGKYGKFVKMTHKSVIVDLSVENWEYRPVSINDIFQAHARWLKEKK